MNDFDANWHKWFAGQGHKTYNYVGHRPPQEVNLVYHSQQGQGHTMPIWKKNLAKWMTPTSVSTILRDIRIQINPKIRIRIRITTKSKQLLEGHLLPVPAKFGRRPFPRSSVILFTEWQIERKNDRERSHNIRLIDGGYNNNNKRCGRRVRPSRYAPAWVQ